MATRTGTKGSDYVMRAPDRLTTRRKTTRPPDTIGLVLADGHPITLHGLQSCLQSASDLEVLDCCASGDATAAAIARRAPAVLVLDLRLPPRGGLAALRALSSVEHS